ncbi:hypothetical protein K7711_33365 [Nocardia sp. CA2R105]|uniref:hypothetical protein n=1 Tax=Nocardia coffeae TaxID=2873381 RepID=UPI001CA5F764|nr:hypothetical protein [Nocardia coffeae]MBY8861405.1 hypothetical protein [Nocardia coffeae]
MAIAAATVAPQAWPAPADVGTHTIQEVDVTGMPDLKNGQPTVAVNPTDPNNLVFTATIFPKAPELEPVGECFVAYSVDAGRSWSQVRWPMGDRPKCGEPTVATDAKGAFYILNNQLSSGAAGNLGTRWRCPHHTTVAGLGLDR